MSDYEWHPTNLTILDNSHSVWKSQKESHLKMIARRAMFAFWETKSSLNMPKMVHFGEFWKPKACGQTALPLYQTGHF